MDAGAQADGGTVMTSMPQLVKGLSRLHPTWRMDGEKFVDRDRHHRAVRRRLRDLDAMDVVRWRIGIDVDGEDARAELVLRAAPDVTDEELADAAAQLARWHRRYGAALNTGSQTGIRNTAARARPLSASVRQRRGIVRTRARAQTRRAGSTSNSAPHFVAPTTSENSLLEISTNAQKLHDVCGDRTGVTRTRASATMSARAAVSAPKTTALTAVGPVGRGEVVVWDDQALRERVAARLVARQPVLDVIAAQAALRAVQVTSWGRDRGWPLGRVREAWVVWRYGARCLAEQSASSAGPLEPGDPERLRRAAQLLRVAAGT